MKTIKLWWRECDGGHIPVLTVDGIDYDQPEGAQWTLGVKTMTEPLPRSSHEPPPDWEEERISAQEWRVNASLDRVPCKLYEIVNLSLMTDAGCEAQDLGCCELSKAVFIHDARCKRRLTSLQFSGGTTHT